MRAVVLSDLHLDAARGGAVGEALVSLLDWLTERAQRDGVPWRLVVLGDLLDFLHPPAGVSDPLAALDVLATRHPSVFAALGNLAASGVPVDLVPGNHDSELSDPELQERVRELSASAAGTSVERLRQTLRVRPWFLLAPGFLYAEHGSQYHALNAVADPFAPFGRWSHRMPPGALLDLGGEEGGSRARTLPRRLPALLRATVLRGRKDEAAAASLNEYAEETGLAAQALAKLRDLAEDSSVALLRNVWAAACGRADYVESRQQRAAIAVHEILAEQGQEVPVYVFGHTHRIAHRVLRGGSAQLLWFNGGAWADGNYGFIEVESRSDQVVAQLCRWDNVARSVRTTGDLLAAPPAGGHPRAATARVRSVANRSADSVASP